MREDENDCAPVLAFPQAIEIAERVSFYPPIPFIPLIMETVETSPIRTVCNPPICVVNLITYVPAESRDFIQSDLIVF